MKWSFKCFDSYLMNFMIYGLSFGEKHAHFSQKSISSWKQTWFILKICKYVWINELYKNKKINGKKSLRINALLLPN